MTESYCAGDKRTDAYRDRLWYAQPAAEWEEALPLGNGRLGAMVYGGIAAEQLQVNEESMWYGGRAERINPDFRENLPVIRSLLDQGRIREAEELMDKAMSGCPDSMHPYQTLGEIRFSFRGIDRDKAADYRRTLDLHRAVAAAEFRVEETVYRREIFASFPADCIVMRFTAQGPGTVDFTARMRRGRFFDGAGRCGDDSIELYGNLGRGGCEFSMALQARAVGGGKISAVGECLECAGAKEVILCFTADTTWHYTKEELDARIGWYVSEGGSVEGGMCPGERQLLRLAERSDLPEYERQEYFCRAALQSLLHIGLRRRLERALCMGYEALLQEHVADYGSLYERFAFELEGTEAYDALPTDRRLERAAEGRADVGLSKLLFDFGRYLTVACSREGGLPSTLQGIWNKDFTPPWDSKYTININTEMNYWHVESCNLPECHMPLFGLLERVRSTGRRSAREMYGCRGFVAHHNTDIHGDSAPQDIWYPGSYWPMGAAWLSTHLWTHYQYTLDREFLERAFPVLAEAALFFVDFLIERDGYLVTSPSVSPENTYRLPNGQSGCCCIGAAMDSQILRHLFTCCLEAWRALGEKEPEGCRIEDAEDIPGLMRQIEQCRDRLMPVRISGSGRIMEWPEDYEEIEPGHRHISHLYALYPGGEITVDGTPKLAAAARRTLEYRLSHGGGHTGWSRAWIMNHYASLWDGEAAYGNIEKMLGQSTYPNLFDRHPPFQIDGNFGACAAMCGMLAQCGPERTVLLPALPRAWAGGSVRGLRLRGNAGIDMTWREGRLVKAEIHADSDYGTDLVYGGKQISVCLKAGESRILEFGTE